LCQPRLSEPYRAKRRRGSKFRAWFGIKIATAASPLAKTVHTVH
jgi:hypothetical protein